ncbi:lysine--tRNA ligase [archaeon]|nr:lysine--tRNA ligase [archaeon]
MVYHWADVIAEKVIREKSDRKNYTVAVGITPSGTIHIGNFREIITVDLVKRALENKGKKVRFIYSWDEYDVFRKVPKNMPKQEMLKKHLRMPVVDIPDPFGKEDSYARHFEVEVENDIARVGIKPEFLYQAKKYRNCEYADGIKVALQKTEEIKEFLNRYRKEPLDDDWLPLTGFCPKCNKDEIKFTDYDGKYNLKMTCDCGENLNVDIRKASFIKLRWRIDWPMRWKFEKVDFEPAGKEHYANPGGSRITANEMVKAIFDFDHPVDLKYDFITIKGAGGKMSSSLGNVITLRDCLEIYELEIVRWLFAGTRPATEFAISFDVDVLKIYEDFDKCERIYFKEQEAKNDKDYETQKRNYELSAIELSKKIPLQPSFRHLTTLVQLYEGDIAKVEKEVGKGKRVKIRAECAKNWVKKYAPEDMKFKIVKKAKIKDKEVVRKVIEKIDDKISDKDLHEEIYKICKEAGYEPKDFFKMFYQMLIKKDRGPKLASFLLIIGRNRLSEIFSDVV